MSVASLSGWPQALVDLARGGRTLGLRIPVLSAAPMRVLSEKWKDSHWKSILGGIFFDRQAPVAVCFDAENWNDYTGGCEVS